MFDLHVCIDLCIGLLRCMCRRASEYNFTKLLRLQAISRTAGKAKFLSYRTEQRPPPKSSNTKNHQLPFASLCQLLLLLLVQIPLLPSSYDLFFFHFLISTFHYLLLPPLIIFLLPLLLLYFCSYSWSSSILLPSSYPPPNPSPTMSNYSKKI